MFLLNGAADMKRNNSDILIVLPILSVIAFLSKPDQPTTTFHFVHFNNKAGLQNVNLYSDREKYRYIVYIASRKPYINFYFIKSMSGKSHIL